MATKWREKKHRQSSMQRGKNDGDGSNFVDVDGSPAAGLGQEARGGGGEDHNVISFLGWGHTDEGK
jgi:hypothetical protein